MHEDDGGDTPPRRRVRRVAVAGIGGNDSLAPGCCMRAAEGIGRNAQQLMMMRMMMGRYGLLDCGRDDGW